MNMRSFNLNLLTVFEVMMTERSTTKAGEILGLSQSAVSNSISQLRVLLDDPLFIRIRNEMVPTPRAREIAQPISECLAQLKRTIMPNASYDPSESNRTFHIGMTDYTAFVLLSNILKLLRAQGPGLKLSVQNINSDQIENALRNNGLDLCIGSPYEMSEHIEFDILYSDDWVCARSSSHDDIFNLDNYLNASHVVVGKSLSNHVDRALAKLGHTRTNFVSVPFCLAAPVVIEESDLYLTLPRRLGIQFSRGRSIELHDLPFKTKGFDVCCIYQARLKRDPGLVWLRDTISSSISDISTLKAA